MPVTRFLDDAASDFPNAAAVHHPGTSLTYRQLLDQVDRFAAALRALGVGRGDRVALVLPPCPQHLVGLFAVLRLGAIAVAVDPTSTADELGVQLRDAGCRLVVCTARGYGRLAALKGDLPAVRHVVAVGDRDLVPVHRTPLLGLSGRRRGSPRIPPADGVLRMGALIARSAPTAAQAPVDVARDPAVLLYSGAAGRAGRGIVLTHRNLVAGAFQARLWVPDVLAGREGLLSVLPPSSPYGLVLGLGLGILSAAALTLVPTFEVAAVLRAIERRRPTIMAGVPAAFGALADAASDEHDLRSVRVALSVGAPLPAAVARAFEDRTGGRIRECYGVPEAPALTHANPVYGRTRGGTVGLPVPDTATALRDPRDARRAAPPAGPGLLAVAGPQVMAGYWGRHDETAAKLVDGWLLTGDVARVDEDGYTTIVDRGKDVIFSGGRALDPAAVEAVLLRHPAVDQAVVAGVPDAVRGERVKAFVVLRTGQSATPQELDAFARRGLPPDQVPQSLEVRDALPAHEVGRGLRRLLVEEELARLRDG